MQNHPCHNEFHLNWPFAAGKSRGIKMQETHRCEITKCLSFSPLGPKSDQYQYIIKGKVRRICENQYNDHQRENALIQY